MAYPAKRSLRRRSRVSAITVIVREPADQPTARPSVQVVSLPEYGERSIPLSLVIQGGSFDFHAEAGAGGDVFQLRFRGRDVVLKAGHFVGQIAVNDRLIVEVVPRI